MISWVQQELGSHLLGFSIKSGLLLCYLLWILSVWSEDHDIGATLWMWYFYYIALGYIKEY